MIRLLGNPLFTIHLKCIIAIVVRFCILACCWGEVFVVYWTGHSVMMVYSITPKNRKLSHAQFVGQFFSSSEQMMRHLAVQTQMYSSCTFSYTL